MPTRLSHKLTGLAGMDECMNGFNLELIDIIQFFIQSCKQSIIHLKHLVLVHPI
jgi:hypothetical protein